MVIANRWTHSSWNPLREWQEVQREFAKLLSDTRAPLVGAPKTPRISLHTGKHEAVLLASLPGVRREDLEISVERDVVTIAGSWPGEKASENESLDFKRALRLPFRINASTAQAKVENGRLELRLSRAPEDAPQRIAIDGSPANTPQETKD